MTQGSNADSLTYRGRARPSAPWPGALVAWWEAHRHELPQEPFQLARHLRVIDPARCYGAIAADIARGPDGAAARMGALGAKLRLLQTFHHHGGPQP